MRGFPWKQLFVLTLIASVVYGLVAFAPSQLTSWRTKELAANLVAASRLTDFNPEPALEQFANEVLARTEFQLRPEDITMQRGETQTTLDVRINYVVRFPFTKYIYRRLMTVSAISSTVRPL